MGMEPQQSMPDADTNYTTCTCWVCDRTVSVWTVLYGEPGTPRAIAICGHCFRDWFPGAVADALFGSRSGSEVPDLDLFHEKTKAAYWRMVARDKEIDAWYRQSACEKMEATLRVYESTPTTRARAWQRAGVTNGLRYDVMRKDNFHCVLCGATGKTAQLVVDHVVPVSKGGKTEMGNLRTLCFECNSGKADKAE